MSDSKEKFFGKTAEFQNKSNQTVTELKNTVITEVGKMISPNTEEKLKEKRHKKALSIIKNHGEDAFISGSFFTFVFGMGVGSILLKPEPSMVSLIVCGSFLLLSSFFAVKGYGQKKQARRFSKLYNIIHASQSQQMSISKLAQLCSEKTGLVSNDLEEMLHLKVLYEGFVDRGNDTLVLGNTEEYLNHFNKNTPQPTASPVLDQTEHAVLSEIREINENIENRKLTAQIQHIEHITGKILEFQESSNNKQKELHSFLSYYLPTTLKILRSYSQLEAQEIIGENISTAMTRIELMMDKVVEGFEKQLDQLFQGETIDITTDISVLEQMMHKDGLAGSFTRINPSSEIDLKF